MSSWVRRYSGTRLKASRKSAALARPQRRAVHRREEPLVGVDDERVRSLDPGLRPAQLRADPGRARVGGVDVEPHAGLPRRAGRALLPGRPRSKKSCRRWRRRPPRRRGPALARARRGAGGIRRRLGSSLVSSPSIRAAFSTDECACSEQRTREPPVTCRAAMSAASVEVDAESSMWPCHPPGSPSSWRSQSSVSSSSSVEAGEVRQMNATWLRVAASSSARIAGSAAEMAKYPKKRGLCQLVIAGSRISSRSRSTAANGSPSSGGEGGSARRTSPGRTCASTGSSLTCSR